MTISIITFVCFIMGMMIAKISMDVPPIVLALVAGALPIVPAANGAPIELAVIWAAGSFVLILIGLVIALIENSLDRNETWKS